MTVYNYLNDGMTIANARAYMCDLVDGYRISLTGNFFTYAGYQWDCDDVSIRNISGANILSVLNGGNLPSGFVWRDAVNVNHPATGAYMGGMAASCLLFQTAGYEAAWQHKSNINALTDIPSLDAYAFTASLWPDPTVDLGAQ